MTEHNDDLDGLARLARAELKRRGKSDEEIDRKVEESLEDREDDERSA